MSNQLETGGQREWLRCRTCGTIEDFVFHNPATLYCDHCGVRVGRPTRRVGSDMAALDRNKDAIVHADDTESVLSYLKWDYDEVEVVTDGC